MIDAIALTMVVGGLAVFAFARHALTAIGNGSRVAPPGMSNVALADAHVLRSKIGIVIVAIGVVLGAIAAVRHSRSRSNGSPA